jgi:hypothetical protein
MNVITRATVAALLVLIALTSTSFAQTQRQSPAKPQPKATPAPTPPPTFETLIPADSYKFYAEVRGVGQLIQSNTVNEILDPILKLNAGSTEFKKFVTWLNAQADELMTSRMLVAVAPARALPEVLFAVEFATEDDAAKIAKPLNDALVQLFASPANTTETAAEGSTSTNTTVKPDLHVERLGSLILLTSSPLNLNQLKFKGSKPLFDDNNFRIARNRFNSEPIFVYLDFKTMDRHEAEQRKEREARHQADLERIRKEKAATGQSEQDETNSSQTEFPIREEEKDIAVFPVSPPPAKEPPPPDPVSTAMSMMVPALFALESNSPDAVGLALSFEGDSFDVRALLINQPGEKSDVVPFLPMLIPGQPMLPESPNILPADTELFITMSLDLPQIYSALSRPRPNQFTAASGEGFPTATQPRSALPFAAIEDLLKIKIKDDLLPLLDSEIALALPFTGLQFLGLGSPVVASETKPGEQEVGAKSGLAILVSVKDKDGMRALLPKLVEGLGFKGASLFAQTERRDDTELVSYGNMFAYAFIGKFLVLSSDAATIRHVVDSYLKRETLSGDSNFRGYTRWQPRPAHGQIYISPALMDSYKDWTEQPNTRLNEQMRALLTRLTIAPQPITYSLSNEGFGPLHELHLPKNLVLLTVASFSQALNPSPEQRNEQMVLSTLVMIAYAQDQYKNNKGNGSYGTLEQLRAENLISDEGIEKIGYRIDMTVSGDGFEVSAVPLEYGKSGTMSYFIDHTKVIRAADRNGAPATKSDPPMY